ncbi:DUF3800 domain-containing protein [Dermabacter sp. HSID17554]|nr:DUF3800 domain-containing protein [Dermabacter sp. HSID17554]
MMWVYIDDSGDGGLKFETGSTSHLVMAACIFREPLEIAKLARRIHECSDKNRHASEFKYSKTKDRVRTCFFECTSDVDFAVRAIIIDKQKLYSPKLRSSPSALKAYAIRLLLTNNFGQVRDAKIFIDGQDAKGFGVRDSEYLTRMVNRESPGTIKAVRFVDSKKNAAVQMADMVAGAIGRSVRTDRVRNSTHLRMIRPRTYQPRGSFWVFT